jgi:glycosyltransferase involved in cell wall biosynthesis
MHIVIASNFDRDEKLGSSRIPLREADELRARGHKVTLLFREDVAPFGSGRLSDLTAPFRFASALEVIRDADVVDVAGFDGAVFFLKQRAHLARPALVCRLNGLWRQVLSVDWESMESSPSQAMLRSLYQAVGPLAFENISIRCSDLVRTLSISDASLVTQVGGGALPPVVAVSPGIDPVFLNVVSVPFRQRRGVVFVGNWIFRKGIAALTDAMIELLKAFPTLVFHALGTGVPEETVLRMFPSSLHTRVQVVPRMEPGALAERLRKAAVFVFPTLYEGYGMVVAEAMASGCAVVTTSTGAGAELIRHMRNGVLVAPRDSRGLVTALSRLLRSPEEAELLSTRAARDVREQGWSNTALKLEEAYSRALVLSRAPAASELPSVPRGPDGRT